MLPQSKISKSRTHLESISLPRRSELLVLITESHFYMLSVPRHLQAYNKPLMIAIKPEHLLEPVVERLPAGRMGLTLSVRQSFLALGFPSLLPSLSFQYA